MKKISFLILAFFLSHFGFGQIGFPYCETFDGSSTQEKTVFGGNARLVDGVLRLTENQTGQRGYVYIDIPFPSVFGIKAEFEYFSYGGDVLRRADGVSFFLFDADVPAFSAGGFGGSLGYAQRGSEPGLSRGYIGIGFDEFGNYGNTSENKTGGFPGVGDELVPDAIVIRGPGNGASGYGFLVGRKTMTTGNDGLNPGGQFPISSGGTGSQRVTDPNQPGYRKVFLELQPKPDKTGYFVTLRMMVTTTQDQPRMVTIFDRPYDFPAPKNLKIGFAASTGGFTNYHEIRNLVVEVSNDEALEDPKGIDFDEIASCEGQENTYFITDEEVVLPNENSEIRCLQFYASLEDIEQESEDICSQAKCREENRVLELPQGIFRAGDVGGDFTFFPNPGFTDQTVTVYYTLTDSYGKSSSGNSMTLLIKDSPEPIGLFIEGMSDPVDSIVICEEDLLRLESRGQEVYERFEWYKDGALIDGATASTLQIDKPGDYEVLGYNRKNCPTTSNILKVSFPDYQQLVVTESLVSCEPNEPVNILDILPDLDFQTYDYLLSGEGLSLSNEELLSIPKSGTFLLQNRPKDIACFNDGVSVEVLIRSESLFGDFDFVVEGTSIRGDADGGIFPDDVIQFTDLSQEAISWAWDFGDGNASSMQNPTHVYGKKGVFQVGLTIKDELGCEFLIIKELAITRSYRVMVPTGFTPLASENKFFLPKHKGLVSIELLVFNTWGDLIFQTTELETDGWDGKLDEKLLDAGVYVFRFDGVATDGERVTKTGKFKLIR